MCFRYLGRRTREAYKVKEKLTHQEWVEQNVYFTGTDVSPIPGAINLKRSPHLIKLYALMDRPQTFKLWGKWASQSAKTLFLMTCLGYKMDNEPAMVLYMQPTKEDIPKIIELKVDPNFKSMPKLWQKFEDYKNTEAIRGKSAIKKIAGGALIVTGSSVKERKSLTTPFVGADEIGEFDKGSMDEVEERTKSFSKFFPKMVGVSTIVSPDDEICTNYDTAEVQLQWCYICPSCENNFYPDKDYFSYMKLSEYFEESGEKEDNYKQSRYINRARETAHIKCPHCANKIFSKDKDDMIEDDLMDWFYEGTDIRFEISDLTTERSFGVDMNSFGSFFALFDSMVEQEIKAQGNEIKLDKLYRGWYNKFYEVKGSKVDENDLLLLENNYEEFEVPYDTAGLYMSVDVQDTHVWLVIEAFTYGMKEAHTVFASRKESWVEIVELMEREFYYQDGTRYGNIKRMAIDMQGYVKVGKEENELTGVDETVTLVDRPLETRNFIYEMSKTWQPDQFGLERIYGVEGKEFTTSGGFFEMGTSKVVIKGTYQEQDDRTVKYMKVGTISCKLNFMQSVNNSILKQRDDETFEFEDSMTFQYINKTICQTTRDYTAMPKTAYVKQISAEEYGYWNDKKGKKKEYKSMRKKTGFPRNDFLDCHGYNRALAIMDNISASKKPEHQPEEKRFSLSRSLV